MIGWFNTSNGEFIFIAGSSVKPSNVIVLVAEYKKRLADIKLHQTLTEL